MPDQQDVQPAEDGPVALSDEIGNSLASVWARYFGARPSKAETELDGSIVRWVLADGAHEFERGMAADAEGADTRTVPGYKRDTSAAVAKATHRRVTAMISKHDVKTGIATETFILADPPRRY